MQLVQQEKVNMESSGMVINKGQSKVDKNKGSESAFLKRVKGLYVSGRWMNRVRKIAQIKIGDLSNGNKEY